MAGAPPTPTAPGAGGPLFRDFGSSLNYAYRDELADSDDIGVPFHSAATGGSSHTHSRRPSWDPSADAGVRNESQKWARVELEMAPRRRRASVAPSRSRDASQEAPSLRASPRPSPRPSGEGDLGDGGSSRIVSDTAGLTEADKDEDVPPDDAADVKRVRFDIRDVPKKVFGYLYLPTLAFPISRPGPGAGKELLRSLPAVAIVVLVNMLEAVTFGAILFPKSLPNSEVLVSVGVFLYILSWVCPYTVASSSQPRSCQSQVTSQTAYLLFSGLAGGIGTQIVEIIPSLWTVAAGLAAFSDGALQGPALVSTVLFAYLLGSLMTGAGFMLLGIFRAGFLVTFFPRHVLIGVIGGIGVFLFKTALEVLARIEKLTFGTVPELFQPAKLVVWSMGLITAVVLMLMQTKIRWDGLMAVYYLAVIALFYVVVFATGTSFDTLRAEGWLYDLPPSQGIKNPFPEYYSLINFSAINFDAIASVVPGLFALTFFAILQVPINIPSIGVTLRKDVDMNQELVAHGVSNLIAGLTATVPSYLTYTTSVIFYRSGGGGTRMSTAILAACEFALLFLATEAALYAPTIIVGSINFQMGIILVKEALFDTWSSVNRYEYLTIIVLMAVMVFFDFTIGVAVGIGLACLSFVVWHGRKGAVRAVHGGEDVRSTVVRLEMQRRALEKEAWRIGVVRLEGSLFFGNMSGFEAVVRDVVSGQWRLQFLLCDFSHVAGVDYSFTSMLLKAKRNLGNANVRLITIMRSEKGAKQFERLGVVDAEDGPLSSKNFTTLDSALEWCENEILRARYEAAEARRSASDGLRASVSGDGKHQVAVTVEPESPVVERAPTPIPDLPQPAGLLLEALRQVEPDFSEEAALAVASRFEKVELVDGEVLYSRGEESGKCWLIESGSLSSTVDLDNERGPLVVATFLPGSVVGELEFFAQARRTTTVEALERTVLWALPWAKFEELLWHETLPGSGFMRIALSTSVTRADGYVYQLNVLT
ncbi:sulfate transporter family-domain-containing protein [Hyaloraphidium curvatum]|nr:sulfate transporter family-domain-containing protein [Hyaloraphidium curvatum]